MQVVFRKLIFSVFTCSSIATGAQTLPGAEEPQQQFSGVFYSGLESHYFSEGRDSLSGDSLWINGVQLQKGKLAVELWYATSPQLDYDELQLFLTFNQNVGNIDFYLGYKRLEFPGDDAYDTEISAGLSWLNLPLALEFFADPTYAFDAGGVFLGIHFTQII